MPFFIVEGRDDLSLPWMLSSPHLSFKIAIILSFKCNNLFYCDLSSFLESPSNYYLFIIIDAFILFNY